MNHVYDAIVVGAGSAGLSAALNLGRARRSTLVLGAGAPRNAPADAAHGFLTRDGTPPAEFARIARRQLEPYGVALQDIEVRSARALPDGVQLGLADGAVVESRAVILATGVEDLLPDVVGLRSRWGKSVHHCPYCHGWEVRDAPIAVYGRGERAFHQAVILHQWSRDLVVLTDGDPGFTAGQRAQLAALGIVVDERLIARLEGSGQTLAHVVFADGSSLARVGLYTAPLQRQRSALAAELGCAFEADGVLVQTDAMGATTVAGVYAAGDMTNAMQSVALAAASGARAAAALNAGLIFADLRRVTESPAVTP
jgi:thioredoxin reductase